MSLRLFVRTRLEAGQGEEAIVADLHCCPTTVRKVREQMQFETAEVDEDEKERRTRVLALPWSKVTDVAARAASDPVTVKRVLQGLSARASTIARISKVLAVDGLSELLPPKQWRKVRAR